MVDVAIISHADILVGEPRSTFVESGMGIGKPKSYYMVQDRNHQERCQAILYREPCMYNMHHLLDQYPLTKLKTLTNFRIKHFYKSCEYHAWMRQYSTKSL
eukprot:gnl/MRDRNA2_/MRDRNA2_66084_c0_seq1.p1 gnl/MRDRNA2_/MRDRNA2_66084_c0~~gnl/MRDRNA2_/MRDRNA2_66084_c0_seq1.p1  ORF type:complete len:113 (-),score=9.36 gnl/MRDRNA2_/MRDRNA2_66084_c0_seq1:1-303(-)